jgi:hypothetical protein
MKMRGARNLLYYDAKIVDSLLKSIPKFFHYSQHDFQDLIITALAVATHALSKLLIFDGLSGLECFPNSILPPGSRSIPNDLGAASDGFDSNAYTQGSNDRKIRIRIPTI